VKLSVGQREGDVVKTLAFVFGLCISAVGVIGILAPSDPVWIAQHSSLPARSTPSLRSESLLVSS